MATKELNEPLTMNQSELTKAITKRFEKILENLIQDNAFPFTNEEVIEATDHDLLYALTIAHAGNSITNERRLKQAQRKIKGTIAFLNHIEQHGGVVTQQEMACALGVTVQSINNRIRGNELLTVNTANNKRVLPLFQFMPNTLDPIPGLKMINKILIEKHLTGNVAAISYWTSHYGFTHGEPLYACIASIEDEKELEKALDNAVWQAHHTIGMGR